MAKFEIDSKFVQTLDLKDGDKLTILDEGEYVDNKWGKKSLQVNVKLPNSEEKLITMNQTSQRLVMESLKSDDRSDMVGKSFPVFKVKQMVQNKMVDVVYFVQIPGEDDDDGSTPNVEDLQE